MKKGYRFRDRSSGEFKITHVTRNKLRVLFTVKITKPPKEGEMSVADPSMGLSHNEFVMSKKKFKVLTSLNLIDEL